MTYAHHARTWLRNSGTQRPATWPLDCGAAAARIDSRPRVSAVSVIPLHCKVYTTFWLYCVTSSLYDV